MKLAIADPPYLGRASTWYGSTMRKSQKGINHGGTAKVNFKPADYHPEAFKFDRLESHAELIKKLENEFDGFALAMAHDNLQQILPLFNHKVKIMIWHKWSVPSRGRVQNRWEPVIVKIPQSRKGAKKGQTMTDILECKTKPRVGFSGAKPEAWTIWVLEALGYEKGDEVHDLFPGSGNVTKILERL